MQEHTGLKNALEQTDALIIERDLLQQEKDWLVKEISHRVKNNLQMIISLLNAQSEFSYHPSALNAIRESRDRMQAIAIIHKKLYQNDHHTRINMRSYIQELVETISSSISRYEDLVFELDVAGISLDISQAVPLGLVMNEAITNAIKYAYAENEKGIIHISLQNISAPWVQLKIRDHGKGLPAGMDTDQMGSLGLTLIRLFAEQLDGELYFKNNHGLEIILNFMIANDLFFNESSYH